MTYDNRSLIDLSQSDLTTELQGIARRYLTARRRSGESLLEAARWLSKAREQAAHGEWQVFKRVTGTSDDTAERLLNIYAMAQQIPDFAEAVANDWIGQTAASILARPSTPAQAIDAVLQCDQPPSLTDVRRIIRQSRALPDPDSSSIYPITWQEPTVITPYSSGTYDQQLCALNHWADQWQALKDMALSIRDGFSDPKVLDTYENTVIRIDMAIQTLQLLLEKGL